MLIRYREQMRHTDIEAVKSSIPKALKLRSTPSGYLESDSPDKVSAEEMALQ